MFDKEFNFSGYETEEGFESYLKTVEDNSKKVNIKKRENLIMVSGKGENKEQIANQYFHLIVNDFNLVVEDICNYLLISRALFNSKTHNYRLSIKHIYINDQARIALWIDEYLREILQGILYKKVLYSEKDFMRFLRENIKVEKCARRISKKVLDEKFNKELYEEVYYNIFFANIVKKPKKVNGVINDTIRKTTENLIIIPEKLTEYKEIMNKYSLKYSTYFYDYARNNWLDRYILNGIVRYDYNQVFKDDSIVIPYCFLNGLTDEELLNLSDYDIYEFLINNEYKRFKEYAEFIRGLKLI